MFLALTGIAINANAQEKLSSHDMDNLAAIGELYSHNNTCKGEKFAKSADSLKTPLLANMINTLIEVGKANTNLMQKLYLARPDNNELKLYYVLREIHYNRIDTTKTPLPDMEIIHTILAKDIDERLLLDNYYKTIIPGIMYLFNKTDLSGYNYELNSLGFKNDTEKAIFFFNMMAIINYRFLALQYLKKQDKIVDLGHKVPKFNGKPYFYYTNLDIPDFEYVRDKIPESYKAYQVNMFMRALLLHFISVTDAGNKFDAREIYFNSIMHKPDFFKYSANKDDLQKMWDKSQ